MEFNGEDRLTYLNRTFRIVNGEATGNDLALSLLLSCHTHIIAQVKRQVSANDKSQKHFALRLIGCMINCYTLQELASLVQLAQTIMTLKLVDKHVNRAVSCVEEMINDWSHEDNIEDNDDDEDDDKDEDEDDEIRPT